MRPLRLLAPFDPQDGFSALYHVTSRVVDKRFIFDQKERRRFLSLAKSHALFCGFELISWCLMSNHFHLLVRAPVQDVEALSEQTILDRLAHILPQNRHAALQDRLDSAPTPELRRQVVEPFLHRIGHLPSYVKSVKQEFSQWYNHKNDRAGTLWEGRYHSTLIEDSGGDQALESGMGEIARIVAAYIDLNPVRAGVCKKPEGRDWSSYAAALKGDTTARLGLRLLWGENHVADNIDEFPSIEAGTPVALHSDFLKREMMARGGGENASNPLDSGVSPTPPPSGGFVSGALRRIRLLGSPEFSQRCLALSASRASHQNNSSGIK